jgi:hypothetical protein
MLEQQVLVNIKERNITSLCYLICESFVESPTNTINIFIEIYSKHYSMSKNINFITAISKRLTQILDHDSNERRIIVELYLLLYDNPVNIFTFYNSQLNNCKHNYADIPLLFIDEKNKQIIKQICLKTIKNNKQQQIIVLNSIEDKYKGDHVWLLWREFMQISKDESGLSSWIKLQFDIFVHRYTKITSKKRIGILFSIIDTIFYKKTNLKFELFHGPIFKKSFIEIILKIDYIYQEIGMIEKKKHKSTLISWAMLMFPKLEIQKDNQIKKYIPSKKNINVCSKPKDKTIQQFIKAK